MKHDDQAAGREGEASEPKRVIGSLPDICTSEILAMIWIRVPPRDGEHYD